MKKRVITVFLLFMTTLSCITMPSLAIDAPLYPENRVVVALPARASDYLSSYSIALTARNNRRMIVTMDVTAVRTMNKVGCLTLIIEKKVGGSWYEVDTLIGSDDPDLFYSYNTADYFQEYSFYGEEGVQYRVTMTAYARDDSGFDTGEVTSYTETCRSQLTKYPKQVDKKLRRAAHMVALLNFYIIYQKMSKIASC